MTDPDAPAAATVTSLVDRIAPAQRARQLARLTMRDHARSREELEQLATAAAKLAELDPDHAIAELEASGATPSEIEELRVGLLSTRAAQRYLRGEFEEALAELGALIEEHPKHAARALAIRSAFGAYRGDFDGALADVQRLIELEPGDADGYSRRGDLLLRQRRTAEARANFLRALQLDPDDLRSCAGMGQSHLREGAWEAALPFYARAIRLAPEAASLRIERALCFENLRRLEEAVADLDVAHSLDPDDAETLNARARCRPASQLAESVSDYTRSLALSPDDVAVLCARASANIGRGHIDEALADANRAIELDATLPDAWFTRGLAWHTRGDFSRAAADYEEAARLDATSLLYVVARMKALASVGDLAGLRAGLDAVIALHPTDPAMQAKHGKMLADEGEFERALSHYDAAKALGDALDDDARAELLHDRASALRSLDRIEEALEDELEATRLAPGVAMYRMWLGMFRAKLPEHAHLAEADVMRAVELAPDDPVIAFHRAVYFESLGRWREALVDHDRAVALSPETDAFYFRRGAARWQSSDEADVIRLAVADYDCAIELGGEVAEYLRWRSEARLFLDDDRGALEDVDRAIALEPDDADAYELRARCRAALGDREGARADLVKAAELGCEDAVAALESGEK